MTILAVDAGRTNCRAAVFTTGAGGSPVPGGGTVTLPSHATLADPDGATRVAVTVTAALHELAAAGAVNERVATGPAGPASPASPASPATLVVAAAGGGSRARAAALADRLASALTDRPPGGLGGRLAGGLGGPGQVVVTADVVAAHAGAFDGGPGVVLAVGTGAAALAVGKDGLHTVVDGAGYLVGDAGSGFAIGRAGLAAALRHSDGRVGGSQVLATAAERRFGPLREVPAGLHASPDPARRVASFAPEVAAAARTGDPVADAIWHTAVADLADTIAAAVAMAPAGHREVALVGAVFELDDLLTAPLRSLVAQRCPDTRVRVDPADALVGAVRLASGSAGAYEQLIVRSAGTPAPGRPEQAGTFDDIHQSKEE